MRAGRDGGRFLCSQGGCHNLGQENTQERKNNCRGRYVHGVLWTQVLHHSALPVPTKQPSARPPRAHPVKFEAFQDPARFPLPFDPYYEIHLPSLTREGSSAAYRETSGDEEQGRAFHLRANQAGGHVPFLICSSTAEGKKKSFQERFNFSSLVFFRHY